MLAKVAKQSSVRAWITRKYGNAVVIEILQSDVKIPQIPFLYRIVKKISFFAVTLGKSVLSSSTVLGVQLPFNLMFWIICKDILLFLKL